MRAVFGAPPVDGARAILIIGSYRPECPASSICILSRRQILCLFFARPVLPLLLLSIHHSLVFILSFSGSASSSTITGSALCPDTHHHLFHHHNHHHHFYLVSSSLFLFQSYNIYSHFTLFVFWLVVFCWLDLWPPCGFLFFTLIPFHRLNNHLKSSFS